MAVISNFKSGKLEVTLKWVKGTNTLLANPHRKFLYTGKIR